jgi:hypothetical protein
MPALKPSSVSANVFGGGGLDLDRAADQHRPADVWRDLPRTPPRLLVDGAMVLAAKHAEQGSARSGLVEHDRHKVHKSLRSRPFLANAGPFKLLQRHEIRRADRLLDRGHDMGGGGRVELGVGVEIELLEMRIETSAVMIDAEAIVARVLGKDRGARSADEVPDLGEDRTPSRRIERRVVDVADQ